MPIKFTDKLKFTKPEFVIGIDTADKNIKVYSLMRVYTNKHFEILLSKKMKDETEFNEEVNNLAKYFNAKIIKP